MPYVLMRGTEGELCSGQCWLEFNHAGASLCLSH